MCVLNIKFFLSDHDCDGFVLMSDSSGASGSKCVPSICCEFDLPVHVHLIK